MKKQFEYKNGIATRINPPQHNQHTPKSELTPKVHPYKLMNESQIVQEVKRLSDEQRYHQTMGLSYSKKKEFALSFLGIRKKESEAEKRAKRDFEAKEGL